MSTTNDSLAVSVDVKDLARAMREIAPVAAKRPGSLPIMQNVLVEALPGRLRLTCANLSSVIDDAEACRAREIPALVVGQGAVTVPARLLKDLARELKRGQVELRHEHQTGLQLVGEYLGGSELGADVLMVHYRPLNLVSRFKAIEAAEFPPIYRDIDLGDWGFLAPVALQVAA